MKIKRLSNVGVFVVRDMGVTKIFSRRRPLEHFSKVFLVVAKSGEIWFTLSKLRKRIFFC